MPIYVFKCKACDNTFDKILSMSNYKQPELEPCPKCNELKVEKNISGLNMILLEPSMYKPTGEFRELLQQIKKNNKGSTIDL